MTKPQDFVSSQEVRWCPGCGDYAILATLQRLLPELNIPRENHVFVSGIGCAGRLPYYLNTYGFHTLHGRAPTVATGLKLTRPELTVWIITGDGDALSIGGNHFIHCLRRNVDVNILLFNNRIYGLTKGQFSPTSERGKVTATSPGGSLDNPINPIALALASGATFVGRALDVDMKHLATVIKAAVAHKGTSFVEIYQNCNIFNDGAYGPISEKAHRLERLLYLEDKAPLTYHTDKKIGLKNLTPILLKEGEKGGLLHDVQNLTQAYILSALDYPNFPVPMGVIYQNLQPTLDSQIQNRRKQCHVEDVEEHFQQLLRKGRTWVR